MSLAAAPVTEADCLAAIDGLAALCERHKARIDQARGLKQVTAAVNGWVRECTAELARVEALVQDWQAQGGEGPPAEWTAQCEAWRQALDAMAAQLEQVQKKGRRPWPR